MGNGRFDEWLMDKVVMPSLMVLIVGMVVGALPFVVYGGVQGDRVTRACLRHGYPSGEYRIIGPSYCIKRVDQTDVVVTLDSLEAL